MLAAVWLDIIFIPLFLAGWETLKPIAGSKGGYGQSVIYADYTHSLLGAMALSAFLGLICSVRWGKSCGSVVGFVAFSHWLLDLIVHRHDMPWIPGNWGNLPRSGFGLWQWPTAAISAELVFLITGALFYWRAACALTANQNRGRKRAILASLLILAFGIAVLMFDVSGVLG